MRFLKLLPFAFSVLLWNCTTQPAQVTDSALNSKSVIEQKIDSIIKSLTLEQKLGQLSQRSNPGVVTGPVYEPANDSMLYERIRKGELGSVLNAFGAEYTRKIQKMALESPAGIPLIIGNDIIHGYWTIFPLPLAQSCSWDTAAVRKASAMAAAEAAAAGIHWTFTPMVDIARDARWGRISEGAGEDHFLGSAMAVAQVKGFQGNDLSSPKTIAACAKHFVAYGLAEGGRDYNTTDVSDRVLREVYLPPFKAACEAGVATYMSAFNELNGVPASGNYYTLKTILRDEWGFKGFIVSDWASIDEMIDHGAAANKAEAAQLALAAGVDMEMHSECYKQSVKQLIAEGKLSESLVDESLRRILRIKFALGLFDDPYKYCDTVRENAIVNSPAMIDASLEMATKSVVLLKNNNQVLPIKPTTKSLAVIGPFVNDKTELNGTWAFRNPKHLNETLAEGLPLFLDPKTEIIFAKGCEYDSVSSQQIAQAVAAAKKAEVVILNIGEKAAWSGEAKCFAFPALHQAQLKLAEAVLAVGKPTVIVLHSGRPLYLHNIEQKADALVAAWFLGRKTGSALAQILTGKINPSGKLTVSWFKHPGQIPTYYNHKNTGRPMLPNLKGGYTSRYLDMPNAPLFAFGYGLSYSNFEYSDLKLSSDTLTRTDVLKISVKVSNTSNMDGEEVVQLYTRDLFAFGVGRPVKELKGFRKLLIKAGQSETVTFDLKADDLQYILHNNQWGVEAGDFKIFVGGASDNTLESGFYLK